MEEIKVFNCELMCQHQFCGQRYTHYEKIMKNGLPILVSLCKEHAEKWEDNYFEQRRIERNEK